MTPDNAALFAVIIVLLPMFYFLLAAPAFLLVRLDVLPVARLLRGMFNGYLLTLSVAGAIGTVAVALTGHLGLTIGIGLFTAFAMLSRRVLNPATTPAASRAASYASGVATSSTRCPSQRPSASRKVGHRNSTGWPRAGHGAAANGR